MQLSAQLFDFFSLSALKHNIDSSHFFFSFFLYQVVSPDYPYVPQWASSVLTHSDKGFCCVDAVWLLIWCLAGKSLFPRFGLSKECVAFSSPLEKRKGLRARVPQCTSWRARRYGTWPESLSDTWLPRRRGLSAQGCTLKRLTTNEDAATRREKVFPNERQ